MVLNETAWILPSFTRPKYDQTCAQWRKWRLCQNFATFATFPRFVKIATFQVASLNISLEFLLNLRQIFAKFVISSKLPKGPLWTSLNWCKPMKNFRRICYFRCCVHFWTYDFTFDEGLHSWAKQKYSCFAF